jgi:hypothetical protein
MGQAAMQPPSQATPNVKNAPPRWPAPIEVVLVITVIRQVVEGILCQQDFSTEKSIHACWEEQFEKLSLGEVAREFLFFCAFFGHQKIPEALLE